MNDKQSSIDAGEVSSPYITGKPLGPSWHNLYEVIIDGEAYVMTKEYLNAWNRLSAVTFGTSKSKTTDPTAAQDP